MRCPRTVPDAGTGLYQALAAVPTSAAVPADWSLTAELLPSHGEKEDE